jgi:hypothetical protein
MTDPIVDEVRAIRAKIAEECGYDLHKILEHAQRTAARLPGLRYVTKAELAARKRRTGESSAPETTTAR